MLPNKFEMPLDLALRESRLFSYYFYLLFTLSVISLFIASIDWFVQVGVLMIFIFFTRITINQYEKNKITRIQLSSTGEWKIEVNNQEVFNAKLEGECIVTYYLTWLNFKVTNRFGSKKIYRSLLLPDSLDKDELRRLRVRLRFLNVSEDKAAEEFT